MADILNKPSPSQHRRKDQLFWKEQPSFLTVIMSQDEFSGVEIESISKTSVRRCAFNLKRSINPVLSDYPRWILKTH